MTASGRARRADADRPIAEVAAELAALIPQGLQRAVRVSMREKALLFRRQARRYQGGSRLADAVAKFGGGSLLTATLLLAISGKTDAAVIATVAMTLLLFVVGALFWVYFDRQASEWEFQAERLEAVLKETER